MARTAKFILKRKDQLVEDVVLESEGLTIGRLPGNDLMLNHRSVADTHAGIRELAGSYWLFKLAQAQQTLLNGQPVEQARLVAGDTMQIGPYQLAVELSAGGFTLIVSLGLEASLKAPRQAQPAATPDQTQPTLNQQALSIFWDKRQREAGKLAGRSPLQPQGETRTGKAQFNWRPSTDLQQPWSFAYFVWGSLLVGSLALAAFFSYRQAFAPGALAAAHTLRTLPTQKTAQHPVQQGCAECHGGGSTATNNKCVTCHQTAQFSPTISTAHQRAGLTCSSCHAEHRGSDAWAGLVNPGGCTECHNGSYRIPAGPQAGQFLPVPHGNSVGYPKVNGVWKWAGLSAVRLRERKLPAVLASRPVSEQFHALHQTIFAEGRQLHRMRCTDCHSNGVPQPNAVDDTPRAACASCHALTVRNDVTITMSANCSTCHQQHGQSRDLNKLLASAGDFQQLKQHATQLSRQGRAENAAPWRAKPQALLGGLAWYGWLAVLLTLPLALGFGLVWRNSRQQAAIRQLPTGPHQPPAPRSTASHPLPVLPAPGPAYPHPVIDPQLCIGCQACVEACPHDVLAMAGGVAVPVALDQCMEDTSCMNECPTNPKACIVVHTQKVAPTKRMPQRDQHFMTNVPNLYLIGAASGVPLIKNAVNEGAQVIEAIAAELQNQPARSTMDYEVAIIGMGPAGLSAALAAQQAGLRYLALEQGRVVNTLQNYPVGKYVFFKPDMAHAKGSLPLAGAGEWKEELIAAWLATVQQHQVKIREAESCRTIQREQNTFTLMTESATGVVQRYRTARLILAIGNHGAPRRLNVPGEDLQVTLRQPRKCSQCAASWLKEAISCPVCRTTVLPQPAAFQQTDKVKYRLGDPADYVSQRCLVVGAGNSAIEAALALTGFQRAGRQISFAYDTEVTLVIRHDFKRDLKFANKANLYDCLDSGRIRIIFGAEVEALTEQTVVLRETSAQANLITIPNDVVFALIGNENPLHFLASLGIQFNSSVHSSVTPA